MLHLMSGLKELIDANQWAYPSHPESLIRAYTTLFQNDQLYAYLFRSIAVREWKILRPSANSFFVKPDEPAVTIGGEKENYWVFAYPLSPDKCFMAGPRAATRASTAMPTNRQLDEDETQTLNLMLASNARREVIANPGFDSAELRKLLGQTIGRRELRRRLHRRLAPPHWGKPGQLWT